VTEKSTIQLNIPDELAGKRLDQALSGMLDDYSRSRIQQWIRDGQILVDGCSRRPRDTVVGGERVTLEVTSEPEPTCEPEPVPLQVLYEDDALIVIDKPPGLVVHPAAGNWSGTMQNGLLHRFPELAAVPRAGIIHRLDKDTSGLLVVARSLVSHKRLVEMMQAREISREYLAIVNGVMSAGGTVDQPVGRHPVDRKRMAVTEAGKPAVTHYRVEERYRAHTAVRVMLETGRTHQIRVHMAWLRYPLVGDPLYGGRLRIPPDSGQELVTTLRGFRRQALHARRLGLSHPLTGEAMSWESPLPDDMAKLMQVLREDAEQHQDDN
jgi:23S rRNA pseudouridine1911/1915/1917 synthase